MSGFNSERYAAGLDASISALAGVDRAQEQRRQLQTLRDAKLGIDIDADAALAELREIQSALELLAAR